MTNYNDYEDINKNVSLEELGRFSAINDKIARSFNMYALRMMRDKGIDAAKYLEEVRALENDYKSYVRAGNCDNTIIYEKRLAVVNKIIEVEEILKKLK